MGGLAEREWTDKFGTHWEVWARGKDGAIHRQKITKMLTGWYGREDARAAVLALAARAPPQQAASAAAISKAAFQSRQEGKQP